jgi:hypothetical protein
MPSLREPVRGAAQPNLNVRKSLDTTLVLLASLADAENLPITLAVHGDRHQKRHVRARAMKAW